MTVRTRERLLQTWASGGYTRHSDGYVLAAPSSGTAEYEYCHDSIQASPFVDDQPLTIIRKLVNPIVIEGNTLQYGNGQVDFHHYSPDGSSNYSTACPNVTPIDGAYWTTRALANADPYNPAVDLPLFWFELKDFPGMLKELGHVLQRKIKPSMVPGGYLSYKFGWAPLVSDVRKLLDFSKQTEDRARYFRNLEWRHHVKRTLFNGEISRKTTKDGYIILTNMPLGKYGYTADVTTYENLRVWYSTNAKLLKDIPAMPNELRKVAFKASYGLNLRAETFWDAIPWTWLSDYLFNIGDYISANQALTHLQVTRFNLMWTNDARTVHERVRLAPGLSSTAYEAQTVSQSRSVSQNPTPRITTTPFLTKSQEGILGALATASALRKFRR
jgi:hypothetical protein